MALSYGRIEGQDVFVYQPDVLDLVLEQYGAANEHKMAIHGSLSGEDLRYLTLKMGHGYYDEEGLYYGQKVEDVDTTLHDLDLSDARFVAGEGAYGINSWMSNPFLMKRYITQDIMD